MDIFDRAEVLQLSVELPPASIASLKRNPREYVPGLLLHGPARFEQIAVRLKGTSSFQPIDKKPSLTIVFNRTVTNQLFHGRSRIYLNNSAEDPTFLNEWIGTRMFDRAGVPAPRVTHALVKLNGRDLGLYVVKEGFTEEFLRRHFRRPDGALYEGGATAGGPDITGPMHRNLGDVDRSHLETLAQACSEPDLATRWNRLQRRLDTDRFISFLSVEILIGHRDGYGLARNNFRLYHDPETGRFTFLPTGMDQLFGRPDAPISPVFVGTVARAVTEIPEGANRLEHRIAELTRTISVGELTNAVRERATLLAGKLKKHGSKSYLAAATDLQNRMVARWGNIEQQLSSPKPTTVHLGKEPMRLQTWTPVDPPTAGKMEISTREGKPALLIQCNGRTAAASWQTNLILAPGKYVFRGMIATKELDPLPFGKHHGASLRVAIADKIVQGREWTGNQEWKAAEVSFEVTDAPAKVSLMCVVRALRGEASFDRDSLNLVKQD